MEREPVTSGLLVSVQGAAEQMLETGIALAKALSGRADSLILGNAVYLAAAVSARHALPGDRFPLSFVNNVAKECRDDDTRLKLLRAVIRGWRDNAPSGSGHERFDGISFAGFIARHWNLLPREEASRILKEIVQWILGVQTEPRRFPITGNPEDPELPSPLILDPLFFDSAVPSEAEDLLHRGKR